MLEVDGQTLAQSNAINCLLFSSRMTSAEALNQAGEKRMTREAEELVQQVEASALTSQITISTSH